MKLNGGFAWSFYWIAFRHVEFVKHFACVSRLRQIDWTSRSGSIDVETEELLDRAKIA